MIESLHKLCKDSTGSGEKDNQHKKLFTRRLFNSKYNVYANKNESIK